MQHEDIQELGRRVGYFRYVTFPVERIIVPLNHVGPKMTPPEFPLDFLSPAEPNYHKYQPGDKAQLNNDETWVANNNVRYTIKGGEILVIERESDDLPNFYTFHHVDQLSQFSLIQAKHMKPVSPDTPHKCYCPKDTVIHYGCQCKGV